MFGSFITNSLWRIRQLETDDKPALSKSKRSVCGYCGHKLGFWDLVPVFSWLALGGKCRYCHQQLSIQYPLIELTAAGLFAWSAVAWQYSNNLSYVSLSLWLMVLTGLIIMAVYDLRWMELPNKVMGITFLLSLVMVVIDSVALNSWQNLGSKAAAALAGGGAFYLLHIIGKGKWMGGGDVKLAFVMGVILGGQNLLVAMFIGFTSAAILSILLLLLSKLGRKDLIPFGPFLIAGTFFAMLYGQSIVRAYLNLLDF